MRIFCTGPYFLKMMASVSSVTGYTMFSMVTWRTASWPVAAVTAPAPANPSPLDPSMMPALPFWHACSAAWRERAGREVSGGERDETKEERKEKKESGRGRKIEIEEGTKKLEQKV